MREYPRFYPTDKDLSKINDVVIDWNYLKLSNNEGITSQTYVIDIKDERVINTIGLTFRSSISQPPRVIDTINEATTKELIYYNIKNYFDNEAQTLKNIRDRLTPKQSERELKELCKVRRYLLNYTKQKQNNVLRNRDFEKIILGIKEVDKSLYQGVEDEIKILIKHIKQLKNNDYCLRSTAKYQLYRDIKYLIKRDYDKQFEINNIKIENINKQIKEYDDKKEGKKALETELNNLINESIPKDYNSKAIGFLSNFEIIIKENNTNKYKSSITHYINSQK